MDIEVKQQENGKENISLILMIRYGGEEANALTTLRQWEAPCLKSLSVWRGLFRGPIAVEYPTFRHFAEPGFRLQGFTEIFASMATAKFQNKYKDKIQQTLAPILEEFRGLVHQEASQKRDVYFGAQPDDRRGRVRIGL